MIKISVVEECPYTKAGTGAARISHNILATLAGAVYDHIEWVAFLTGKRSRDGMDIEVTGMTIPLQTRDSTSCETVKEEPLAPEVVGVVHSHHTMTAFFSGTDNTKLNPRFPISIVIAQNKTNIRDECRLLGFDYLAEGRVALPCGSIGIVRFNIQPLPMVKEWPIIVDPKFGDPDMSTTLRYCNQMKRERVDIMQNCSTKCGLNSYEPATALFGRDGEDFLKEVRKNTVPTFRPNYRVDDKRHHKGVPGFRGDAREVYSEDDFLRHWSRYPEY